MERMAVSCCSLPLFLLLLLLIACSSSALLSPPAPSVTDEVVALESMRNLLEDPQDVLTNWDPMSADPCSFSFVTCSTENLVIRLEAPSRNLSGCLSSSIGNLTNLQSLVLSDNNITGTIPVEIGKLARLKELNLSSNHLYGEIPSWVFHLESLRYLDLSYNNLSGPIPKSFAGELYVVGNPLICGKNTGRDCSSSRTAPVPASSQASLPTAKTKSYKFVVAFGSTVACIIFLFFPIS